jgi:hypothetical protein
MTRKLAHLIGFTVLLLACASSSSTSGHLAPQQRGSSTQCAFGAANAPLAPVTVTLSPDIRQAALRVPQALRSLGYRLEPTVSAVWHTVPRDTWPAAAELAPYQSYPYPVTAVELVLVMKGDSAAVIGFVRALCLSSPQAPDSIVRIAQTYEAHSIMVALSPHQ